MVFVVSKVAAVAELFDASVTVPSLSVMTKRPSGRNAKLVGWPSPDTTAPTVKRFAGSPAESVSACARRAAPTTSAHRATQ